MSLLDAKEYDPRPAQRRNRLIAIAVILVVAALIAWRLFRYWPEEHAINNFFQAIEQKDFEKAYALYWADPNWKQHPDKYKDYTLSQFMLDWGPSGDYGEIKSHNIECATEPPKKGFLGPSGVIVVVRINNLADKTTPLWVEKNTKSIAPSPDQVLCHGPA